MSDNMTPAQVNCILAKRTQERDEARGWAIRLYGLSDTRLLNEVTELTAERDDLRSALAFSCTRVAELLAENQRLAAELATAPKDIPGKRAIVIKQGAEKTNPEIEECECVLCSSKAFDSAPERAARDAVAKMWRDLDQYDDPEPIAPADLPPAEWEKGLKVKRGQGWGKE